MELSDAQKTLLKILMSMQQTDESMNEDNIIGVMLTVKTTEQIEELFDFIKYKNRKHELTRNNLINRAIEINQGMDRRTEYDFNKWNVPLIQEPQELMKVLKSFELKGKKILKINIVGKIYNLDIDSIEDYAFNYYKEKGENNYEELSNYDNIPDDTPISRCVEINEPAIIYFEGNEKLEVDFSEASSIKIGKNSLSNDIKYGINASNIRNNANIIFSNCEGKVIEDYEIIEDNELGNEFTGSHGIEKPENQIAYIKAFRILLGDGLFIEFKPFYDYGNVAVYQKNGEISTIKWEDLKKYIEK